MADAITLPTTQRAYTLRLHRAPGKCPHCGNGDCSCWRDALWAAGNDPRAVLMLLWLPASNSARLMLLHGVSQRLDREIGAASDQVRQNTDELCSVRYRVAGDLARRQADSQTLTRRRVWQAYST